MTAAETRKKSIKEGKRSRLLFYCLMMLIPTVQFVIFYLSVNFNSVLLAFKAYDKDGIVSYVGFQNFGNVISDIFNKSAMKQAFFNSLILGFCTIIVGMSLALTFSFYIYKKAPASGFFKVVLFLPQILSAIVMTTMFKYFVEAALPVLVETIFKKQIPGLLYDINTQFPTIVVFSLWMGIGTQILMYSGAMSGISDSVTEAAKLDGASPFREFISITVPMIWPTLTSFIVVNLAQVFVNQMNLFSFYGTMAEPKVQTLGYYLYAQMKGLNTTIRDYPYLSAFGLVLTAMTIPVTLVVKKLLDRAGNWI